MLDCLQAVGRTRISVDIKLRVSVSVAQALLLAGAPRQTEVRATTRAPDPHILTPMPCPASRSSGRAQGCFVHGRKAVPRGRIENDRSGGRRI